MYKFSLVLLAICLQASDIHISEVMSNPQGSEYENEFIELFNCSEDVIHINNWVLSDGNGIDTLMHLSGPMGIQSHGYALILDPGYNIANGQYAALIPDSLPLYTLSTDASFGSGGLANSGEMVIIRNEDTSWVCQMSWTMASDNGYSWERVAMNDPDSIVVWEQSLVENGTPGFRNSVTAPQLNLSLNDIIVTSAVVGETIEVQLIIENTGENQVAAFSSYVFLDEDQNGQYDMGEWDDLRTYSVQLESQEILELTRPLFSLMPGVHLVMFVISTDGDENSVDDTLSIQLLGSYPKDVVSINEIMFSPAPEQGGEWIEIMNVSEAPITLQNWSLSDANQRRHVISTQQVILEVDSFITICAEEEVGDYFNLEGGETLPLNSWPTLNASSDSVRLFDATGQLIARAYYRGSWGTPETSLERRHPRLFPLDSWNWLPSVQADGGTPSQINSQQLPPVAIHVESVDVPEDNPTGPGVVTMTLHFSNQGLDTLRSLQIECGDMIEWQGVLPSFHQGSIVLTTPQLPAGISTLFIRLYHENDLMADTTLQITLGFPPDQIALSEINYLPNEDQVEFLELVNMGTDTLNLIAWAFEDRSGTHGVISTPLLVPPDSLFLLCGDATTLADWSPFSARICQVSPWPSLNNSSDSIFLTDPQGNLQVIHGYEAAQGGDAGKSLERLALWKPVEENATWSTCLDPTGITPGRQNSVQIPQDNLRLLDIHILDSLLFTDQDFVIEVQILNDSEFIADSVSISVQILREDEVLTQERYSLPDLIPGDTLLWQFDLKLDRCGWVNILSEIHAARDHYSIDDRLNQDTYISCDQSPLVINEIMPMPINNQPEWVELYNRTDRPVDLLGWQISDNSYSGKTLTREHRLLSPKAYIVLSANPLGIPCPEYLTLEVSDFPTLNNSADAVILFNPSGIEKDSVSYGDFIALSEGRSLERIRVDAPGSNTRNWGICIDESAATPGSENSLNLVELASELVIHLSPNPFTPNGDGKEDELGIYFELPVEQGLVSIIIFDMAGRRIAEPVLAEAVGHRGQLSWPGDANYGGKAVTGLYIMQVLVDDLTGHVYKILKKIYLVR